MSFFLPLNQVNNIFIQSLACISFPISYYLASQVSLRNFVLISSKFVHISSSKTTFLPFTDIYSSMILPFLNSLILIISLGSSLLTILCPTLLIFFISKQLSHLLVSLNNLLVVTFLSIPISFHFECSFCE